MSWVSEWIKNAVGGKAKAELISIVEFEGAKYLLVNKDATEREFKDFLLKQEPLLINKAFSRLPSYAKMVLSSVLESYLPSVIDGVYAKLLLIVQKPQIGASA